MGRNILVLATILITLTVSAQTIIPGGNVSGTWPASGSPYLIEGEINIPDGQQLTIDPGVDVIFQGHYMLIIRGTLIAEGTEIDSIKFTAVDTSEGWWGLRLFGSDACSLFYCIIEYARSFGPGGPEHIGGGLYSDTSSPVISHCRFTNNRATTGGGMGFMWYSNPTITNCLVDNNWAQWGGGIFADEYSRVRVLNCTVTGNTGVLIGGGIRGFLYCGYAIINTLVEGNFGAGGVNLTGTIDDTIMYCDFYNNEGGDLVGSVPPDAGIIVTTNNNGDSCDIYFNIFEDPEYYSTVGDSAYFLTSNSSCIDAGDPAFALDPDSTIADIGAHYYHQGYPVSVTLIPHDPPIVLPDSGGSFDFTVILENLSAEFQDFDFWIVVELPEVGSIELFEVMAFLPGGVSIERIRTQSVPANAPGGTYTYWAFVGDRLFWNVDDYDFFTFEKLGGDGRDLGPPNHWLCTGERSEEWQINSKPELPRELGLVGVYPNPFNPSTVISYQLSVGSQASLEIYDISGRLIESPLHLSWREAGYHEVTLEGNDLPSGIYFVRLTAGNYTVTQKIVLIR
jgi:hypothetical protein